MSVGWNQEGSMTRMGNKILTAHIHALPLKHATDKDQWRMITHYSIYTSIYYRTAANMDAIDLKCILAFLKKGNIDV